MTSGRYSVEFLGTLADGGFPTDLYWTTDTPDKTVFFEKLNEWISNTFFINLPEDVKIFISECEKVIMIYHRIPEDCWVEK